jgi:hypothetical protein
MDRLTTEADHEPIDLESVAAARRRHRQPATPAQRERRRRWVRGGVLVLLLAAVAAGLGLAALGTVRDVEADLVAAQQRLDRARTALGEGRLADAVEDLRAADATFESVPARLRAPVMAVPRLLPRVDVALDAVADLSTAAAIVTGAVDDVLVALDLDQPGGLGALAPADGRIPLDVLAAAAPVIRRAEADVARAVEVATAVPTTGTPAEVAAARGRFLDLLEPASAQLADVADAVEVLPPMLGSEGPRTYLVAASNPTEARGTGGYLGAFTTVTAEDGHLEFAATREIQDLPVLPRGRIPWPDESLELRYDDYGGTGFLQNINMTPDFPSAATAIERYYAEAVGVELDGVIALDPYAFEGLLRIAGPVDVPGVGQVDADGVVEFVSHDAYALITDPERRKALIGQVATASFARFLDNPAGASPEVLVQALAEMARRDAIKVHAVREAEQAALAELGLSGGLPEDPAGDYLGVFLNSGAPYKVDYWLQRGLRYDVVLGPDGIAAGLLSTSFQNGAPTSGEPDYMIGQGVEPLDVGDALSYISVYCAPGCRFYEVPDAGFDELVTSRGLELGFGVSSTWMRLPAGRSRELAWSYSTPGGWQSRGRDMVYRLHYDHQTTILPVALDLRVAVPEGFRATGLPDGAEVVDGQVRLVRAADEDVYVEVVFSPTT